MSSRSSVFSPLRLCNAHLCDAPQPCDGRVTRVDRDRPFPFQLRSSTTAISPPSRRVRRCRVAFCGPFRRRGLRISAGCCVCRVLCVPCGCPGVDRHHSDRNRHVDGYSPAERTVPIVSSAFSHFATSVAIVEIVRVERYSRVSLRSRSSRRSGRRKLLYRRFSSSASDCCVRHRFVATCGRLQHHNLRVFVGCRVDHARRVPINNGRRVNFLFVLFDPYIFSWRRTVFVSLSSSRGSLSFAVATLKFLIVV